MILFILYYPHLDLMSFWKPNPHLLAAVMLLLMGLGYYMISRYPMTVVRLRRYLEDIIKGQMSEKTTFVKDETDIMAIERSLNIILSQLRERIEMAERERTRLERELKQAQKLKVLGIAAAGLAHELKTPVQFIGDNIRFLSRAARDLLSAVHSHRSLIGECSPGPETERAAAVAARTEKDTNLDFLDHELDRAVTETWDGLDHVVHAVDAMKDFSHMRDSETKTAEDINAVIGSTVTVARNQWKHVAELELDLDHSLPPVPCLGGDIRQVFLNLVVNAAQALASAAGDRPADKGRIVISTHLADDAVEIRVSDSGPGIPENVKCRIFEPFFTTRGIGEGSGQGLAICHSIVVKKHGGTLSFDSREGEGTTFIVSLPLRNGT